MVALNRTVALAEVAGLAAALAEVKVLARTGQPDGYAYLPAVQANLLTRLGRPDDAVTALRRARELTENEPERTFITEQLAPLH